MPPDSSESPAPKVAIIGGGPAGLMAAETLAGEGLRVDVFDAMPSVGRKFLMAGKGGLNLSHTEPADRFVARYGARSTEVGAWLQGFGVSDLRDWAQGLGVETFVGSSGRVFPKDMKAAPLLRAWLHRLRGAGVRFHMRHRWLGWDDAGSLRFDTPDGAVMAQADATVLALGGGSWPQLGSDGRWAGVLAARGVDVAPLRPANCGFDLAWTAHFRERFAGQPVKNVELACVDPAGREQRRRGEFVVTAGGIEGGVVYALSAALRDAIEAAGEAVLRVDLLPDRSEAALAQAIAHPRGSRSMASHLQSRIGLAGVKAALLRECTAREDYADAARLAAAIKALPLRLVSPRPLAEAISSAGGVTFGALDDGLMLRGLPGTFCAGEMIDWEAPTGGYLLTACFASGRRAGRGVAAWLAGRR